MTEEMGATGTWELASSGSSAFAVVVLAAGSSKQTHRRSYLGLSLVERAARTALGSGAQEVVVVAGERAQEIRDALSHLPVRVVQNREWREGLSSSIRSGVSRLRTDPGAVVVCLCDQPRITAGHLRTLAERVLGGLGSGIAASAYDGVVGAPAAFARCVFDRLMALTGPEGARRLIRESSDPVEFIQFADADERLETPIPAPRVSVPRRQDFATDRFCQARDARAPPQTPRQPAAI